MPHSPLAVRLLALGILVVGGIAGFFASAQLLTGREDLPILNRPFRLGLDLAGGTHLVYRADLSGLGDRSAREAMEGLRDAIERRVNLFGVTEPVVEVSRSGGEWRLNVELAGIADVGEAIRQVGRTALLEFQEPREPGEAEEILVAQKSGERLAENPYFRSSPLTGAHLGAARVEFDRLTNAALVTVEFDAQGQDLFAEITRRNVGRPLAIVLDGELLSAPVVQEEILGGKAQISGRFSAAEARELALLLNAGALPVPVTLVVQETVGPALGAESLQKSFAAALAGFLAVALFMLAWYRLPGAIAVLALIIYAAIVLALFKLIPVTLTAAGIAGFILSLGMAVDANILIFERMKEELRAGKDVVRAVGGGFSRAWTSIRDANVSTLITAAILFWFGQSLVKGFALTLGIGVFVSLASAFLVSRTFLLAVLTPSLGRHRWLFLSGIAR